MTLKTAHRWVVGVLAAATVFALAGCGGSATVPNVSAGPGLEIVLRPVGSLGARVSSSDISRSVEIMRSRLARLGGGSVSREPGSKLIVVRLDRASIARGGARLIAETAQLDFYDLTPSLLPPSIDTAQNPVAETSLYGLLSRSRSSSRGAPGAYYLFKTKGKKLINGPQPTRARLLSTYEGSLPKGTRVLSRPAQAVVVRCDAAVSTDCPDGTTGVQPVAGVTYYYLFKHGWYAHDASSPFPQMTGLDLKSSRTRQALDPTTGFPIVTIQFNERGDHEFLAITKAEAERGAALGVEQSFAIVLDDQLYSNSTIDYTQFPTGIDPVRGGAEITGLTSLSEAKHVALVLQAGALPVHFVIVSRKAIH